MLEALFGNKNIQNILLFLFVNGKCYGTQLSKNLKAPLTPLQKALHRLEKGDLITSYYEGKTRLYRFNPTFPLLNELEQLLKKTYTLLPASEKKFFYVENESILNALSQTDNKFKVILEFWERLSGVTQLTFQARTKSKENRGWNGKGKGDVIITKESDNILISHERGSWFGPQVGGMDFSNVFRWTLDRNNAMISLEHLRRGPEHPVFLFHLSPSGSNTLASVDSHLCEGDAYFGQIRFDRHSLRLYWRVIGPKKDEELDYYYY